MNKLVLFLFLISIFIISVVACKDETDSLDCTGVVAAYTTTVKAILDTECAVSGCHVGTSPAGGLDLSTYTKASAAAKGSKFLCSIEHTCSTKMPLDPATGTAGEKLSDVEIKVLKCWIEKGTPEN